MYAENHSSGDQVKQQQRQNSNPEEMSACLSGYSLRL
jgi:hypothetical protein